MWKSVQLLENNFVGVKKARKYVTIIVNKIFISRISLIKLFLPCSYKTCNEKITLIGTSVEARILK